jgi:hypothetical protein
MTTIRAGIRVVDEYDFDFQASPVNLTPQLESCLHTACRNPGSVAWLAFEASFHFDHLLADDVANQVYGLCAYGDVPLVVVDEGAELKAQSGQRMVDYRGGSTSNPDAIAESELR